jgi:cobyric acid synthase
MGRSRCLEIHRPFIELERGAGAEPQAEGSVAATIPVVGTHVHGVFEHSIARHALVQALAASRGFTWSPATAQPAGNQFDVLANVLEASLQLGTREERCIRKDSPPNLLGHAVRLRN